MLSIVARALASALTPVLVFGVSCSSEAACGECRDEKCADLVDRCSADEGCACMSDCLGDEGIPGVEGCLGTCGLTERPADFIPVEECVAVACPDTGDECSTPDGWEPPQSETPLAATTTADVGGGDLPDCSFDPDLAFNPEGSVLQLETADKSICVRLERRNEGAGSLANTRWTLLEMHVGALGSVAHVTDSADLCYYSSHHNFADWAHAWTGTRHHDLKLAEDGHGGGRTYGLYTFEQGPLEGACAPLESGTTPVGEPVELHPATP